MLLRHSPRKLCIEAGHRNAGRGQPRILRIQPGPLIERVLGQQQQMLGLLRKQLVRFVALAQLHRFVANAQRAHLEPPEVLVGGRVDRRKLDVKNG